MRELVERGYIYIAQPPLYKIRKGKNEQYLKDNDELARYQTQVALDGSSLYVNAGAPAITGETLEAMVRQFNRTYAGVYAKLLIIRKNVVVEPKTVKVPMVKTPVMTKSHTISSRPTKIEISDAGMTFYF
jgi:DNA gyrase/topoisomerase IV subunit B